MMSDQAHGLKASGQRAIGKKIFIFITHMGLEKNDMYLIYFFAFALGAGVGYYLEKIFI